MLKKGDYIQINLIGSGEMLRINKAYKGKNYATDVLTFNYSKDELYKKGDMLGEIYVNLDIAKKQAKENNISVEKEIAHLVEHAMLHMQGVHHKGDGE